MTEINLSNEDLLIATTNAIADERNKTAELIRLFQEIADRRLYLDYGYPTMFEMVTKHFGYCAGSAHRRIQTARLIESLPEFENKIENGELSLTAASQLQSFFHREASDYSRDERIELVQTCLKKSTREVEAELCRRNPERERRETIRPISESRLRVSFSISAELNDKIDHLKALLSHTEANISTETLLERLVELGLDRHDPKRKAERAEMRNSTTRSNETAETKNIPIMTSSSDDSTPPAPTEIATDLIFADDPRTRIDSLPAPEVRSRYIRATERHKVARNYDGGGCEFMSHHSGRRCGSKHFLQRDHIESYSAGGENSAENLQMLCGAHNKLKWRRESAVREPIIAYGA